MGFCLLRRDGDTVALIVSSIFETRADALAEVARLSAGEGLAADEVFMVDIDAAVPVLIVAPPSAEPPVEAEADKTVEEQPQAAELSSSSEDAEGPEPAVVEVEAAIAEAVLEHAEEQAAEPPAEPPDLVEPSDERPSAPSWPWDVTESDVDEEPAAEVVGTQEVPAKPETDAAEPVLVEPETEAPEALTPDVTGALEVPDEAEPTAVEPASITGEAPPVASADSTAEEADIPDEVSGLLADLEEIVPTVPAPSEPAAAFSATPPLSPAEEDVPTGPKEAEPAVPEQPVKVYEPGTSDLTEMTCDDCIYLNTCPKKDESDPSNCGSFQWKSI